MASKNHRKKAECEHKIKYFDPAEAWEAARKTAKTNFMRGDRSQLVAYVCPFSGERRHYHVGHAHGCTRRRV